MFSWTLGATTRPWHAFSFEVACQCIAEAGYTDVAIYANEGKIPLTATSTEEEIEATLATVRRYGLKASMLLGGPDLTGDPTHAIQNYRRLVDVAAKAGIRYLMNGGTENPTTYDRFFEITREVAPYAASRGVELQLKPHGGIGLTGKDLRKAWERVGNPAFTICYDPGNIIYYTRGAVRPEPDVVDVADCVTTCIVKDCVVVDGKPDVWIQPGTGWINFKSVFGTLARSGFRGPLYVECLGGSERDDINRRARETYEWLKALLRELE